jgi:hypothetical protein
MAAPLVSSLRVLFRVVASHVFFVYFFIFFVKGFPHKFVSVRPCAIILKVGESLFQ